MNRVMLYHMNCAIGCSIVQNHTIVYKHQVACLVQPSISDYHVLTEKAYFRNLNNQFLWHVAPWDLIQISPDQHPVCGCVYQPKINKQCTPLSLLCLEHTTWNELSQPDHSPLAKRVDNSPSSSYFLKGHSSQSKCFFFFLFRSEESWSEKTEEICLLNK